MSFHPLISVADVDPPSDARCHGADLRLVVPADRQVVAHHTETDQIVGREAEVARLADAVSGAVAGSPSFLVLEGPPGVGKSVLLSAATIAAARTGARVLQAAGSREESALSFGVVGQLFELALDGGSEEDRRAWLRGPAQAAPQMLSLDTGDTACVAVDADRRAASRAFYWLTVNMARRAPLVVVVDDLQWADSSSLGWLVHLSRRMQRLPLAVIATLSPDVPAAAAELVAQLRSGVDLVSLSGLDAGSVARLAAERVGVAPTAELVAYCLSATGGKPLLVQDLLRVLAAAGTAQGEAAGQRPCCGSPELGQAVLLRLSRQGPDVLELATTVAVLGEGGLEAAAAAAGLPLATAVSAAAALDRTEVIRLGAQVAFRHELVRGALLAALPEGELGRLRVQAARALFDRCAPAPTVAAILMQAATPVGEQWAVEALWSEARAALADGSPERALAALRRLLVEPHQTSARARYLAELGTVEVYQDLPAAVEHLRAALPRLDEPAQVARAACRLAGALLDSATPAAAAAVLSDAIRRVLPHDPELADELDLQRLSVTGWSSASTGGPADDLDSRLDRIRGQQAGRLAPAAQALRASRLSLGVGDAGRARALATSALDGLLSRDDVGEDQALAGLINAAAALLRVGEHQLLIEYCRRLTAQADGRGLRLLAVWAHTLSALAHHAVGEHLLAAARAREVLEARVCARAGMRRPVAVLAAAVVAGCCAEQDQYQEGLAVLAAAQLDGDLPESWVYNHVLLSRGRLRLAAADAAGALADLLECGRRIHGTAGGPITVCWRSAAAAAYAALGKLTEAVSLAKEQLNLARAAAVPGLLAEALTAYGILSGRRQPIREAIGLLAGPGTAVADVPVRQALDLLRRQGAVLIATQLQRLTDHSDILPVEAGPATRSAAIDRSGRWTVGAAALTAHERRLIKMAIAGQTNGAIARCFGVSRRAVEFHFTHIYRKLGITGRTELVQP